MVAEGTTNSLFDMAIKKVRIAILGIGGVGGYYGGKLASRHQGSKEVEIIFISRGENARAIREKGLRLITTRGEETVYPAIVSSDASEIGPVDFVICAVKSYDLESSIKVLAPCIKPSTVILPLLNGVDSPERIKAVYPKAEVWLGCVYIIVRLAAPGVISETGGTHSLYFGSASAEKGKLQQLERILSDAGIEASIPENIEQRVWEKFVLISAVGSLTSYLDLSLGQILGAPAHKQILLQLLSEIQLVAQARGVALADDITQRILEKLVSLPYETTSSMHSDFQRGGKTELQSLTGYVVKQARLLNVETPVYDEIFSHLKSKALYRDLN